MSNITDHVQKRNEGWMTHRLVIDEEGNYLELISFAYQPDGQSDEWQIQARIPGQSKHLWTYTLSQLSFVFATCDDKHVWHPYVYGERSSTHVYCDRCGRRYDAEFSTQGEFLNRFGYDTPLHLEIGNGPTNR